MDTQEQDQVTIQVSTLAEQGPLGVPVFAAQALDFTPLDGVKFLWLGGDEVGFGLAELDEPSGTLPLPVDPVTGEPAVEPTADGMCELVAMVAGTPAVLAHVRVSILAHIIVSQGGVPAADPAPATTHHTGLYL